MCDDICYIFVLLLIQFTILHIIIQYSWIFYDSNQSDRSTTVLVLGYFTFTVCNDIHSIFILLLIQFIIISIVIKCLPILDNYSQSDQQHLKFWILWGSTHSQEVIISIVCFVDLHNCLSSLQSLVLSYKVKQYLITANQIDQVSKSSSFGCFGVLHIHSV